MGASTTEAGESTDRVLVVERLFDVPIAPGQRFPGRSRHRNIGEGDRHEVPTARFSSVGPDHARLSRIRRGSGRASRIVEDGKRGGGEARGRLPNQQGPS